MRSALATAVRIIIVGAGIAGMAAAHVVRSAGHDAILFEAEDRVGGLLRTDSIRGYAFERSGHFLHTRNPHVDELIFLSGIEFCRHVRNSAILFQGKIVPYPLQYNIWAIPTKQRMAILRELDRRSEATSSRTFLEFLIDCWGPTLGELFFIPYNEKLWGVPLDVVPPNCAGKYMPPLSLELVRKGATAPTTDYGYNATFECPTSGRIGDFADGIARSLSESVNTGTRVEKIDVQARRCVTNCGEYLYDYIVSTAPLPQTMAMTGLAVTESAQFRSARVWVVRVGFVGRVLRPEQWYYIPDRSVPFYRIVLPTNFHAGLAPQGRSILSIEVAAEACPLVAESVARDALEYLADVGAVIWSEIEVVDAQMIDPAYVFHRAETSPSIVATRRELERHGVFSAGRYGEWEYFSIDQAARSGFEVATKLVRGGGSK